MTNPLKVGFCGSRALAVPMAALLREAPEQSKDNVTVALLIKVALQRSEEPSLKVGDLVLKIDGAEAHPDDFLADFSDQWQVLSLSIERKNAPPAPPPLMVGVRSEKPIQQRSVVAPAQPQGKVHAPAAPTPKGRVLWQKCNMADEGFPQFAFTQLSASGAETVKDVKRLLLKLHNITEAFVGVIIANSFTVVTHDHLQICDLWSEGDTCIYYTFYHTAQPHRACMLGVGSKLSCVSSISGEEIFFACMRIFACHGEADGRTPNLNKGNFLRQLLKASGCPSLVSVAATYLANQSSALSVASTPFLVLGMHTLFSTMLRPHAEWLDLKNTRKNHALEHSRECFAALMNASMSASGGVTISQRELSFDIPDNIPATFNSKRSLATLTHEGDEVVFDVEHVRERCQVGGFAMAGRDSAALLALLPTAKQDGVAKVACLARHCDGERIALVVVDDSSRLVSRADTFISDIALCARLMDSPDFAKGCLRVVGPKNLRTQNNRSCITLNGTGEVLVFVSMSKDVENVNVARPLSTMDGDESMKFEAEAVKLESFVKRHPGSFAARTMKRKDAQSDLPTAEDTRPVEEAIVVLFDCSSSMGGKSSFPEMTRLALCQQSLRCLVDRLASYNFPFRIQLASFNTDVKVLCKFTSLFFRAEECIKDLKANGNTSLYDSIVSSCDSFKASFPTAHGTGPKRHIFVLSDGEDMASKLTALDCIRTASAEDVVIDSICIGEEGKFAGIKAICLATGGLCFKAGTTKELFHFFESEPLLRLGSRPLANRVPVAAVKDLAPLTAAPFSVMPRKPMPAMTSGNVLSAAEALVRAQRMSKPAGASQRFFRAVLRALASYESDPHPLIRVYPSDEALNFWMFLLQGPDGTPYDGGRFLGFIQFPQDFPDAAPVVRMITPMYHCNINADGRVCHSVLDRNWNADISVRRVFDCVYGLLLAPDPEDPLDTSIASEYFSSRAKYDATALEWTTKYATEKREDLLKEIAGLSSKALDQMQHTLPEHFLDPITFELLEDPVITPTGRTYSRATILKCLSHKKEDPLTRTPLTESQLIPNRALAEEVERFKKDLDKSKSKKAWWEA
jgi:ubiquitin-protein ligase